MHEAYCMENTEQTLCMCRSLGHVRNSHTYSFQYNMYRYKGKTTNLSWVVFQNSAIWQSVTFTAVYKVAMHNYRLELGWAYWMG